MICRKRKSCNKVFVGEPAEGSGKYDYSLVIEPLLMLLCSLKVFAKRLNEI